MRVIALCIGIQHHVQVIGRFAAPWYDDDRVPGGYGLIRPETTSHREALKRAEVIGPAPYKAEPGEVRGCHWTGQPQLLVRRL